MPSFIVCPTVRHFGGFCPRPAPGGAPVEIIVNGFQTEKLVDVRDQIGDTEDQLIGVAILREVIVHFEPEIQVLRILNFV